MFVPDWVSKRVNCNCGQRWMRWFKISEQKSLQYFWKQTEKSLLKLRSCKSALIRIYYLSPFWLDDLTRKILPRNISRLYLENCMSWLCSYMPVHCLGKKKANNLSVNSSEYSFRRNAFCLVGVRKLLCHQVLPMFFFLT